MVKKTCMYYGNSHTKQITIIIFTHKILKERSDSQLILLLTCINGNKCLSITAAMLLILPLMITDHVFYPIHPTLCLMSPY